MKTQKTPAAQTTATRPTARIRVQCNECQRRWMTTSANPQCPKCNSADVEPAVDQPRRRGGIKSAEGWQADRSRQAAVSNEFESLVAEAVKLVGEGSEAVAALRNLPAGRSRLRSARVLLAGLRQRSMIPQDQPKRKPARRSRAAKKRTGETSDPRALEALNRAPVQLLPHPDAAVDPDDPLYLDGEPVDLGRFFADNDEDSLSPEERAVIEALRPGQHVTLGGGAAPLRVVSRGVAVTVDEIPVNLTGLDPRQRGVLTEDTRVSTSVNAYHHQPEYKYQQVPAVEDETQETAEVAEVTSPDLAVETQEAPSDLTEREQALLRKLWPGDQVAGLRVTRKTEREFDLGVEGPGFRAWLPLTAIRALDWTSARIADLTDYPEMVKAGDWSGVRDSSKGAKWTIFEAEIRAFLGLQAGRRKTAAAPAKTIRAEAGAAAPKRGVSTQSAKKGSQKAKAAKKKTSAKAVTPRPAAPAGQAQILGYGASPLIRWMSAQGWSLPEVRAVVAKTGVTMGDRSVYHRYLEGQPNRARGGTAGVQRPKAAPSPADVAKLEALRRAGGATRPFAR